MEFKNKIIITMDMMIKNIKKILLEIVLLVLCFCLFSFGAIIKADRNRYRKQIEMLFSNAIDRVGLVINVKEEYYNEEMYNYLMDSGKVEGLSQVGIGISFDAVEEMQIEHGKYHQGIVGKYTDHMGIQPGFFSTFNVELEDGEIWDYKKNREMWKENQSHGSFSDSKGEKVIDYDYITWYGVYLGYDYMDVPVGTKFITKDKNQDDIICEVLGHLKKDSEVVKDEYIYIGDSLISDSPTVNLNSYVVYVYPIDYTSSKVFIKVKDDCTLDEVNEELKKEFNTAHIEKVEDILSRGENRGDTNGNNALKLFFLIGIVTISLILCFEVLEGIKDKKYIGILIASGGSGSDIFFIRIYELIIKYIVSTSIGISIVNYYIGKKLYRADIEFYKYISNLWKREVLGYSLLVIGGIFLLANIIPLLSLSKTSIVDLIRSTQNKRAERIFRDCLSSVLLIITLAICVFSAYSFSDILSKYKLKAAVNNKYNSSFKGRLEYNFDWHDNGNGEEIAGVKVKENIKKSEVWSIIKKLEAMDVPRKRLYLGDKLADDCTDAVLFFDFSNEYLDDVSYYLNNNKMQPGVFISKELEDNITVEAGRKYISYGRDKYLVKGVYKDLSLGHDDYRIVIPWDMLNKSQKTYFINKFSEEIMDIGGLGIEFASDEDIGEDVFYFNKVMENNNLHLNEDGIYIIDENIDIYKTICIVMIVFSVINAFTVAGMWMIRRRDEFVVKKTWGMSDLMIYWMTLKELFRHLIASVPLAIIIELIYILIFKEIVIFSLYKYLILFAGVLIILLVVAYAALLRTQMIKPAEGLREE